MESRKKEQNLEGSSRWQNPNCANMDPDSWFPINASTDNIENSKHPGAKKNYVLCRVQWKTLLI